MDSTLERANYAGTLSTREAGRSNHSGIWIAAAALLVILALLRSQSVTMTQIALASVFLLITVQAYVYWSDTRNLKIPIWPMLCGIHFIYYGVAIFISLRGSPSKFDHGALLEDSTLTGAMLVGLAGLVSMMLGRRVAVLFAPGSKVRLRLLDVRSYTPLRIHLLLLMGIASNLFGVPFFGSGLWYVSVVAFSTLPMAAFLWIVLAAAVRGVGQVELGLAGVFFLTRLFYGASSAASLSAVLVPPLLVGLAAVSVNRRLPWRMIAIVAFLVFFLQPTKIMIRRQLAVGDLRANSTEVLQKWFEAAVSGWADALSGSTPLSAQFAAGASRASLLTMTGVILDKTPDLVPYQRGTLYPLLLQNLVPRFLWADKPTVNVANQFFQVEYGLTEKENLSGVSIACGFAAEGYMNFGWPGVIAISILMGFIFGYYEHLFFSFRSSLAATAVGLALLPNFLSIESQLVQYVGGMLQVLVAACIALWDRTSEGR